MKQKKSKSIRDIVEINIQRKERKLSNEVVAGLSALVKQGAIQGINLPVIDILASAEKGLLKDNYIVLQKGKYISEDMEVHKAFIQLLDHYGVEVIEVTTRIFTPDPFNN